MEGTEICDDEDPSFKKEAARPQFGSRFLTNADDVYAHNAWDRVVWDDEQEAEARQKVSINAATFLSQDRLDKYEHEAHVFWDEFYEVHQNRFFKDRNWLFTEFPELKFDLLNSSNIDYQNVKHVNEPRSDTQSENQTTNLSPIPSIVFNYPPCLSGVSQSNTTTYPGCDSKFRIFEVGCGVGNTVFPILETNNSPDLFVYGADFSERAIGLVKGNIQYDSRRCHAFTCDVTSMDWQTPFPEESIDIIILIFVLSAIDPAKMQDVVSRLSKYLKPNGLILFRDYGRYDLTQLRFKMGHCLSENFYVRGDGTRVYFFTQDELKTFFTSAGLIEVQNYIDRRLQVNRGRLLKMYRVWIQCKYRKPG